jgi:hypothetical protein
MDIIDEYFDKLESTYIYYNGHEKGNNNKYVHIMSMTKSFIGIIYGFIFKDKLIKPKDKVCQYIEEWNKKDYNKITFDELLTHKSGLIDNYYTTEMYQSKNIIQYCIDREIKRDNKFRYSNSGYNILGYLVKKITNKLPSKYLKSKINIQFKWQKIQNQELGMAHILMKGKHIIQFIQSIYIDKELYNIIKYCSKHNYGISKNKYYYFQDGYGGQTLFFNKNKILLHLKIMKNITPEEYKKYLKIYDSFYSKLNLN